VGCGLVPAWLRRLRATPFLAGCVEEARRPGEGGRLARAYLPWMGSERRETPHRAAHPAIPDPVILEFRYRPEADATEPATENAKTHLSRAELARQLNASIYRAGQGLSDQGDEDFELAFVCACGCMAEVRRSLREYVIRGAVWKVTRALRGRSPRAPRGGGEGHFQRDLYKAAAFGNSVPSILWWPSTAFVSVYAS